jgi:hypothetical protein
VMIEPPPSSLVGPADLVIPSVARKLRHHDDENVAVKNSLCGDS